jgi:hypothetical protein
MQVHEGCNPWTTVQGTLTVLEALAMASLDLTIANKYHTRVSTYEHGQEMPCTKSQRLT